MFNIARAMGLLLCLSVSLQAEGELTPGDPKIIGGEIADVGDWTSTVALFANNNDGTPFCGGALIAPRWVLTAAHCVIGENTNNLFVWVGSENLNDNGGGEGIKVKKIITHPKYNTVTFENDLALLELKSETAVYAIPLFIGEVEEGTQAAVVGWGSRNIDPLTGLGFNPSRLLYELQLPIVGLAQCRRIMEDQHHMGPVTKTMICAGTLQGGQDTCQGDSGGPLMVNQNDQTRLVGIVSWGIGCAEAQTYGVYTRVNSFSKWIKSNIDAKPSSDKGGGAIFWIIFPLFGLLLVYKNSHKIHKD